MFLNKLPGSIKPITPVSADYKFALSRSLLYKKVSKASDDESEVIVELVKRAPLSATSRRDNLFGGIPYTPGVTMVVADTSAGKTQTALRWGAHAHSVNLHVGWVTLHEPARYSSAFNSLDQLADTLLDEDKLPHVLIIDSLRLAQFTLGGNTRAGGVASGLFEFLTELNNAAEEAGIMLIALFNPLVKDDNAGDLFDKELSSSVHQFVRLTAFGKGTFSSRSQDRSVKPFSIDMTAAIDMTDTSDVVVAKQQPVPFDALAHAPLF